MATKKEKELREFAKKMLVQMRTDQELLTSKNEVLKDIRSRLDECLKKVNNCGMTNGIYSTTQMAKELGMSSAHKLYEELREAGIAFCQGQEWMLASRYSTYQLTEVTTHIVNGKHIRSLLWTERGRRWLLALKEKNVICSLPKPKTEVKKISATPLTKKVENLKDEISCLINLISEVGKGEASLLMGDIMTISTTINDHVSPLAFETYKTLNTPA